MELARIVARNTAPDSENRMHDDVVASQFGFRGGLVPGVTVYGYMAAPLGLGYLESGGMSLRLLVPFYDGDEVVIVRTGNVIEARSSLGVIHASGSLRTVDVPDLSQLQEAGLPDERPRADTNSLAAERLLGTIRRRLDLPSAEALLELSNRVLMDNVKLMPWIHAGSEIQHVAAVRPGEEVSVRARVLENFERKGHRMALYETAVYGDDNRLIQYVRHTAIYEPKQARAN